MRHEEKVQFILNDDRNRELREQNKLEKINQVLNGPTPPNEIIEDDFQTACLEVGEEDKRVYHYVVPDGKALVITEIGNDWYPGLDYTLKLDGHDVLGTIEREIAPTNNPVEVRYLAQDEVTWEGTNTGDEQRDIGIVNGGHFIPLEVYRDYVEMFDESTIGVDETKELVEL